MEIARQQVLAFRLMQQGLETRLPPEDLLKAAGACAVQNTPPGSAGQALQARIASLTPEAVSQALESEKSLLQSWSLRTAPHIYPTADASVFTLGLLPDNEDGMRAFMGGVGPALDQFGLNAVEMLDITCEALLQVLEGREMTKDELGAELAAQIGPRLPASQRALWKAPSWIIQSQSLGESVVRFFLPLTSLRGLLCHAGRRGNHAFLALEDRWLGHSLPHTFSSEARAELVRRYLHTLGPSTAGHFADWAGISPQQAVQAWHLVEPELRQIDFSRRPTWLLEQDHSALLSATLPAGVRLLPPGDPFLNLRDRSTLIANGKLQRLVWRTSGNPGVVLVNGEAAALWRPEKKGNRLRLRVQAFSPLSAQTRREVESEAELLAPFRGAAQAEVRYADLDV